MIRQASPLIIKLIFLCESMCFYCGSRTSFGN